MPRRQEPPSIADWRANYLETNIEPEPDNWEDELEEASGGCNCDACRPYNPYISELPRIRTEETEEEQRQYREQRAEARRLERTCSNCAYVEDYPLEQINGNRVCYDCRRRNYRQCRTCGYFYQNGSTCTYCPPDCTSVTYGCHCGYCRRNGTNGQLVQNWDYKPDPVFHGKGPLYLGMELEIGIEDEREKDAAERALSELGKLGYLKRDGSVTGFELVTHPMSYEYAMSEFPWKLLSDLAAMDGYTRNGYGLHVHVSRDGFSNPMHLYRWMKFFYRNSRSVELIARRRSNEWTNFNANDRKNIKTLAKGYKSDNGRYQAINTQNDATLEIRVFRSSLDQTEVKASLALADASVEYTRNLSTKDILQNKGWSWQSFINWAKDQNGIYLPLTSESDKLVRTGI